MDDFMDYFTCDEGDEGGARVGYEGWRSELCDWEIEQQQCARRKVMSDRNMAYISQIKVEPE